MGKYDDIIEMLEKAERPSTELDMHVASACGYMVHKGSPTASLDAAIAITERLLPGHYREFSGPRKYLNIPTPVPGKFRAEVTADEGFDSYRAIGWGETEPIALLIASFRALQAQDRE